ncbi:uncharacterized protein IL334_004084 [Kwoniella shivajii]|uniref:Glycosyl transferase CAP10 domain-containing protein n=1 Tax=Kwoniella shivajii TaxID=564305 RepID=A0ABZ1CZC9_9TREE|nr:hypothetical protein IL334_004084 [Kwoniella shivajii]
MPRLIKPLSILCIILFLLSLSHYLFTSSIATSLTSQWRNVPTTTPTSFSADSLKNTKAERPKSPGGWSSDTYTHSGLTIDHKGLIHWKEHEHNYESHPIGLLIERGKELARLQKDKIDRIRNLKDSYGDYQEAFGMNPPRGFDVWYTFTQSFKLNTTPVPSLIPLAHNPILSFLSLPVNVLRERIEEVRLEDKIYTITFVPPGEGDKGTACDANQKWVAADMTSRGKGRVVVHGQAAWDHRCNNTLSLILPILPLLPKELFTMKPPLVIPFSIDDGPRGMVHNSFREKAESLAKRGKAWPKAQLDKAEQSMKWTFGWAWTCPEGSPLKSQTTDVVLNDLPEPEYLTGGEVRKSFIADFDKSADCCSNPELMNYYRAAVDLVPVISTCKTKWHSDILGIPTDDMFEESEHKKWEDKTIAKVFWRGSATGMDHSRQTPWRQSQRERLHFFSHNVSSSNEMTSVILPNNELEEYRKEELDNWLDIGLSGVPLQCHEEDGSCEDMRREIEFMGRVKKEDSLKYKYVMDVDGNGWSGRFRRLLSDDNVVFKSTLFIEWYNEMLIPWYHYVPIKLDYSDIHDIMAFFVGSPDGTVKGHDELAREIAKNAIEFVDTKWRLQDMQSFMFLLLLEYWRLMSDDRQAASFEIQS